MVAIFQTLALVAAATAAVAACKDHEHKEGQGYEHGYKQEDGHQWEGEHHNDHSWQHEQPAPPPPAPPAHHYTTSAGPYYPSRPTGYIPSSVTNYISIVGTATTQSWKPSSTISTDPNRATHRVIAGFNGLHFEPENIVAEIGDLVEVHFNPKNHSFAQSSFTKPCVPLSDDAIFSGFMPTAEGENPNVFTITIEDNMPKWFYCSQTKMSHCQMGMAMVINQNFDSPNTLAAYKAMAAMTGMSISPPKPGNGGTIAPPPNGPGL